MVYPEQESRRARQLYWVSRALMAVIAIVLLVAGFIKAFDMRLFIRQIQDYGIIGGYPWTPLAAFGLIAVECGLGAALLVNYRPRLALLGSGALFLMFLVATLWAWSQGTAKDCGCFGSLVERTPAQAALEDVFLLAGTAIAWLFAKRPAVPSLPKLTTVIVFGLAGLLLPLFTGYSLSEIQGPSQTPGKGLGQVRVVSGSLPDLSTGSFLIALMDTGCHHCREAVFDLNVIQEDTDLPQVVALCTNSQEDRTGFEEEYAPIYPLLQVEMDDFLRLLGDADTPRYILLWEGQTAGTWDTDLPEMDALYPPQE